MAVRIRLKRMGRKKRPFYRIVAADRAAPRDGRHIEVLGHYNPMTNPHELVIDFDRVEYWLSVGATPSETVASLIKQARGEEAAKERTPARRKRRRGLFRGLLDRLRANRQARQEAASSAEA